MAATAPLAAVARRAITMEMQPRIFIVSLACVAGVTLSGNRAIPRWQGHGNFPMSEVASCVQQELEQFGRVNIERGYVPEEGSLRLKVLARRGSISPLATIYLNGEEGFTAIWMDAETRRLGDNIWRKAILKCRMR